MTLICPRMTPWWPKMTSGLSLTLKLLVLVLSSNPLTVFRHYFADDSSPKRGLEVPGSFSPLCATQPWPLELSSLGQHWPARREGGSRVHYLVASALSSFPQSVTTTQLIKTRLHLDRALNILRSQDGNTARYIKLWGKTVPRYLDSQSITYVHSFKSI